MRFTGAARIPLALTVLGLAGLLPWAGGYAVPGAYPGAETIDVYWMSGVINGGRACVGVAGLHGSNAYDLIADNSGPPCYDGGVAAAVSLRTLGYSSTPHATLRATMYTGQYANGCDYIEAHTVQKLTGTAIGTYRYLHTAGTAGQWADIWAGPSLLPTETSIGSTTYDSNCTAGWEGYHTHQDSGIPTCPWSQPNSLTADDDIPVWDPGYWIHKWIYPLPDTDGDGFNDAVEGYVGTDRLDKCPDNPSDDAWPPDINRDTACDVSDVLQFSPDRLNTQCGEGAYWKRLDLDVSCTVDVSDVLKLVPYLNTSCQ